MSVFFFFLLAFYLSTFSFFFFSCSLPLRALLSFPTRRSSDLGPVRRLQEHRHALGGDVLHAPVVVDEVRPRPRSEEHTSELQSPYDLVCRLLLEKKKKKKKKIQISEKQK